jgi:hypothetical protein
MIIISGIIFKCIIYSPISPIHSTITIFDLMAYSIYNYSLNPLLHYDNLQQIMEINYKKHN